MTFKTLYELYATDLKEHARESTYRTHLSLVRRHVLPFWEKLRLDQIAPADVRRWQGEIKKHGLAPHTQYVANCYLSTIFNFAVRYYNLPSNPCRTVSPDWQTRAQPDILDAGRISEIFTNCHRSYYARCLPGPFLHRYALRGSCWPCRSRTLTQKRSL